jgi:metal-responsive CopG/Arc/MetJ family transcriptional regulator
MKRKTSVTLSDDLLDELERTAGSAESRSAYIERVLRQHFRRRAREAREIQDIERLNAAAGRLNAEMSEVLEFQSAWPDE